MNIVILDLEWNGAYSRRLHGFINEIIEFGAVKLDAQLNITDRFSCFVKPQVTKKISAVISDLTSITDANLLDARPYMQVMSRFKKWAGDCVIATWGTSDILALIENCRYFGGGETVPFLQRYVDARPPRSSLGFPKRQSCFPLMTVRSTTTARSTTACCPPWCWSAFTQRIRSARSFRTARTRSFTDASRLKRRISVT